MASLPTRANKSAASITVPDEVFARALKQIKGMNKAERIESLKKAGILTPSGNYTKPYRMIADKRGA